jgi:hypothetical protein
MGRKRKIKQELKSSVDYMNEYIPIEYDIRRKVAINYDKVCGDLGIDKNKMLDRMMNNFVLEVYRDRIKNFEQ